MDLNTFISENYIVIIIVGIITVMTIIGYFAQKTEFGAKVSNKSKKEKKLKNNNVELEEIKEEIETEQKEENFEELDIFDTIAPEFNDGGLMIGDVNQNPEITNEQLGITEDLYAPFGDENNVPGIEELKIEEVEEINDFIIDENKEKNKPDERLFNDINQSLDLNVENIEIEEISQEENEENLFAESKKENMVLEEINNIVDNTFVLNEATTELENQMEETTELDVVSEIEEKNEINEIVEESPIEEESYDLESTTTLKLDEINEKIKNLKLEDLENLNFEEDIIPEPKKKKKSKKVTIKSVEDIKNEKEESSSFDTKATDEFELPIIDSYEQQEEKNEETVSETVSEWNF